jgi:Cof subfamily protein (haloacid dehalogenase superfamily)
LLDDFVSGIRFDIHKLLLAGEPDELDRYQEILRRRYDGLLDVYKSAPYFLEMMPFGVSKGSMLPKLLEHLGVEREELLAFGDNYNDLTMIGYAGTGVATDNAETEVKRIANFVCESNDDDGVAKFIEQYML